MKAAFSPIERSVARFLGKVPLLKRLTKSLYSRLVYFKARKKYSYWATKQIISIGPAEQGTFFGYYDKIPTSKDGHILCHVSTYGTLQDPAPNKPIYVTLLAKNGNKPLWQAPSNAYNWQQGSRAHWLDEDLFIFNDFEKKKQKYISRVFSQASLKEVRRFDFPVQDSLGKKFFLSINYRRLFTLRPDYGYRNLPQMNSAELANIVDDGIWHVDFESGRCKLLVTLAEMIGIAPKPEFSAAIHKVNHIMISPNGEQFIYLHRYYIGRRRYDRLMLATVSSGKIKLLADHGMVSHCFWADEKTIIGFLRGPCSRDAYWLINTETGEFSHFANGALDAYGDGHPHVQGDWFVTDTYPDKARMQRLILANWKTGEFRELGEFFHGFDFSGETRCDLHPRLSPCGKKVFFDSVFDGTRKLYMMDLAA
jgi:hypothetical protein